ncbi:MAG TPA: tryptophan--tRNA ligase [Polyangiaceae bacterium]|jgi:tryptophanyl-tRNA synthetase|nr:tryptophan--tRNA ligase [Polyangiaceae bacterium]
MATIFSGMQPTGEIHLGNYLGALRQWVELGKTGLHHGIYCVVDCHAFTAPYDPKTFPARVFETALTFLAGGLADQDATVFVQSDVPEHMELAWYLGCVTPMGDLGRMTQFKEKSEQHKTSVNAGLFTYPVLMAADILLYKATLVPVGHDQLQHLELARDTARHFNHRFGKEVFPEPKPHPLTLRIRGTDGNEKMSKSRGNAIGLLEPEALIWKKLKGAFTDPQRTTREIPGRPEICNIFTMHGAVTPPDKVKQIDVDCRTAAIGCGDCKKMLAESLEVELVPIRKKADELRREPERVTQALADGAAKCRAIAKETMAEVKDAAGVRGSASRP